MWFFIYDRKQWKIPENVHVLTEDSFDTLTRLVSVKIVSYNTVVQKCASVVDCPVNQQFRSISSGFLIA